jgi:two-component system, cell cycle response regulator DivK
METVAIDPERLVLVVEDFGDARELFCEVLQTRGFRCVTAKDGAEAIVQAHEHAPDVVLLDLSIPVVDGWMVARSLRTAEKTREIPIVVVTGHSDDRQLELALRSGADRVLTKPVQLDELVAALRGPRGAA